MRATPHTEQPTHAPNPLTPPKPETSAIPHAMLQERRWVCWRYAQRDGKWTKVPCQPDGRPAKSDDPATWTTWERTSDAANRYGALGVGFMLGGGWIGIDLDHCRDPQTGAIEPWAQAIVDRLRSYAEASPSGTGVHVLCRGALPPGRRRKGQIEVYDSGRFFTITGARLNQFGAEDRTAELAALHAEVFGQNGRQARTEAPGGNAGAGVELDDQALICRALAAKDGGKFARLWAGQWQGEYASPSEADLGLASLLAFWTGGHAARIDRLFRQSGLYRPKWERDDYREATIARALEGQTDFYWSGRRTNGGTDAHTERPTPGVNIERESDTDWTERLPRTRTGIRACQLAVELAFEHAPELRNTLVFDEFSGWIEVRRNLPWRAAGGVWTDADLSCLTSWLQSHGIYVTPQVAMDGVRVAALKHRTHPVREYLSSLVWDGHKRIERMTEYYGAEPDPVVSDGLKRWIVSAVARIMRPGCRADLMPVFEGRQGIAKSRSVEALFTPWFTDHIPDLRDKDAMLQLLGIWCVEISELRAFRGAEWETVKAFISQPTDRFRKPYDRLPAPHPRTCVFAGSTNTSEWLDDPTGGRRFIPVLCGVTRPKVDVDGLARDRDQIWAEAMVLFDAGEPWWLPQELESAAADLVDERYSADPWEAHISRYIALKDEVSTQDLFDYCLELPRTQQTKAAQTRTGMIMARLGWRRVRRQVGGRREYVYVPIQDDQR
jgi:putative DNA primase/helicase